MATGFEPYDAVVIRVAGSFEPLHALYQRRILPVVEKQIAAQDHSVQRLLGRLKLKTLSEADLNRYGDWQRALLNVNTPEEWEEISHG
jgi:molybdopterin-guanine dinucleotide biosynthesis protein A